MSNTEATSIFTILTGDNARYVSDMAQAEASRRADSWLATRQTD
jgi:hypothetical protein